MTTEQKNRPTEAPHSAQQRNGAARSAQAQRSAAGIPEEAPRTEKKRPVSGQSAKRPAPQAEKKQPARKPRQAPPEQKKASGAKTAVKPERPEARKTAPKKKEAAAKAAKAPAGTRRASAKSQEPEYTRGLPDSVSTRKRAYGNSKPKKKTILDYANEAVKRSGEKKAEKIKARQAEREKGSRPQNRTPMNVPAVIYTQPQSFNRSRFLMQMVTVVAMVVALVMGVSVFFKVQVITVSGAEVYSTWAVRDASGIEEGDNLLTFSHARAGAQIKANLPYVKRVRFGIKLPDTVNIMIEEEDVVYAIKSQDGTWWLMNSNGRMVEQANNSVAAGYTQVLGVTVADPVVNERGIATESAAVYETDESGATVPVPVSVTGAQRLGAALQILQALEDNDIVGEAASVDVTRLEDIILWYGTRFQVNLGDSTNIGYKIDCMNDCILQMGEYQTGVMDISFTIWPNQVGFTPFG